MARNLASAAAFTAIVGIALFSSGCGRNDAPTTADAPAWDPCAAFPESAMQELGLNYKVPADGQTPGMRCTWANSQTGYSVDVEYWNNKQYGDWKSNAEDISNITAGAYEGHTYHVKGSSPEFTCVAQLGTKNSSVIFRVTNQNHKEEDPCGLATRVATALDKYLPPSQ